MHDPNTLAFRIGQWLEIWHVDPCVGGDDDSAGWSSPKLNEKDDVNVIEITRWSTDKNLWQKSGFEIIAWIWGRCNFYIEGKNRPLNVAEIEYCLNLSTNTVDNLDWVIGNAKTHEDGAKSLRVVHCIYRAVKRHKRKWWQHPKWNIARWRVELHWPKRHLLSLGRKSGEIETDW